MVTFNICMFVNQMENLETAWAPNVPNHGTGITLITAQPVRSPAWWGEIVGVGSLPFPTAHICTYNEKNMRFSSFFQQKSYLYLIPEANCSLQSIHSTFLYEKKSCGRPHFPMAWPKRRRSQDRSFFTPRNWLQCQFGPKFLIIVMYQSVAGFGNQPWPTEHGALTHLCFDSTFFLQNSWGSEWLKKMLEKNDRLTNLKSSSVARRSEGERPLKIPGAFRGLRF